MLRRLLAVLREAILARPRRVLLGSAVLLVIAILFAVRVEFRTSRSELAPPDDPEQRRFDRFVRETGGTSTIIACVEATEDGKPISELREFTDALAEEIRRNPLVAKAFEKADLDWFLERSLFLAPPQTLGAAVDAVEQYGFLDSFVEIGGFADLNELIARQIRLALRSGSVTPADGAEGLSPLVDLIEAQRRFIEDPDGFAGSLEGTPPLLALAAGTPVVASGGYLTTRDGRKMFVFVNPESEEDSLPTLRHLVGSLRASADRVSKQHPGFRVAFTGQPAMTVEEMDTVRRDTWFTSVAAIVGVTLLTVLVFRWKTHAYLVLAALAAGVGWAMGAVFFELGYLNLITSSFLSTLVGVGVAYGIHPVSEYELEGAHAIDPIDAVREAYHRTGAPVTVAAITTSAAFLSILLMEFQGFAELGLVAGIGVLFCLMAALVTLPALLVVYGRWRHRRDRAMRAGPITAVVDRLWVEGGAARVCRFPKTVAVSALVVTAGLGWMARGIGFDTDILRLLPRDAESLKYQRRMLMESDFSPIFSVAFADSLETLADMADKAASEKTVGRFESVLQFLPSDLETSRAAVQRLALLLERVRLPNEPSPVSRERLESSLRALEGALADASEAAFGAGMGKAAGRLEEARAAAEAAAADVAGAPEGAEAGWGRGQKRLLRWTEALLEALRRAAASKPPVVEDLPAEIRGRYVTRTGGFLAFLHPAGDVFEPAFLEDYVKASRRISPQATGFPIVFHRMAERITKGFYRSILVGSLLVLVILLVDFRSVRDAALAIVPLAVGVVWMLGLMGAIGVPFNFANLVAVPLIIGIGIDNGVHVIHRVRLEGRGGMTIVLRHTGRAILIASLTTMIGFGSLALASHRGLESLGIVLLLGVGSCLITSTIVLPNLLVALGIAKN